VRRRGCTSARCRASRRHCGRVISTVATVICVQTSAHHARRFKRSTSIALFCIRACARLIFARLRHPGQKRASKQLAKLLCFGCQSNESDGQVISGPVLKEIRLQRYLEWRTAMTNALLLPILAATLLGTDASSAQTPTTGPSPAFGYPSYSEPGPRSPAATTNQTYSPSFGYPEPNTDPPTKSGETHSLGLEKKRAPVAVGR
jgi:hypothetical protein